MKLAYLSKADAAFFQGIAALVRSIRAIDDCTPIYVYDCGLTSNQVMWLQNYSCTTVPMSFEHQSRPGTVVGTHYNDTIYALMHFSKLDIDAFVHLDADSVVFPSMLTMFELLEEYDFVGVPDHPPLSVSDNIGDIRQQEILRGTFPLIGNLGSQAINAGIFGAKMASFRKFGEVMQHAYESDLELPRRDQSLINIALLVLNPKITNLGIHFNFRHLFRRDPTVKLDETRLQNGCRTPYYDDKPIAVMHYIGPNKPWMDSFDRSSDAFKVWKQFAIGEMHGGIE